MSRTKLQPKLAIVCPDCGHGLWSHRMQGPLGFVGRYSPKVSRGSSEYRMINIQTKKTCKALYKILPLGGSIVISTAQKPRKNVPVGKRRERRSPARHR